MFMKKVKKTKKQIAAAKKNIKKAQKLRKTPLQRKACAKNFKKAQKESLRLRKKSKAQAIAIIKRTKDPKKIAKYRKVQKAKAKFSHSKKR
jgi:hypothetical protein